MRQVNDPHGLIVDDRPDHLHAWGDTLPAY